MDQAHEMDPSRRSHWFEFALICKESWEQCSFQEELVAACGGHEDIAWAFYYRCAAHSLKALDDPAPALGHVSARDLIHHGKADRVRECLWRMQ